MGIINNLMLANWPTGFWENLISAVFNFIGDYGLTIILFTVALKILLLPLDYFQRKSTKDNAEKQARLQPKIEKLNKKYANNKEMLNQKTMELYKKENYNIVGSCFGMLINLAVTLVIFITLFGAMNNISQFKIADQYTTLEGVYTVTYEATVGDDATKILAAEQAVSDEYEEIKEGFLWINNIWRPDRNTNIIPTYTEYNSLTNSSEETGGPTETEYLTIMGALSEEHSAWNGYFVLILGAAVITFLSQKILQKFTNAPKPQTKKDGEEKPQANTKFMLYLMPALMILFTWGYSSAFALYIITNSAMTMLNSIIAFRIIDKQNAKKKEQAKQEYSR